MPHSLVVQVPDAKAKRTWDFWCRPSACSSPSLLPPKYSPALLCRKKLLDAHCQWLFQGQGCMMLASPSCSCALAKRSWIRQARRLRSTCAQVRFHGAQLHTRRELLRNQARRELLRWQAHPGQRPGDRCARARLHAKLTPSANILSLPQARHNTGPACMRACQLSFYGLYCKVPMLFGCVQAEVLLTYVYAPRNVLNPSTLPACSTEAQNSSMLHERVFAKLCILCAGSVLPIWQTLFDVMARSSSSSTDGVGKKVWPRP